jgi:hypothetical protein
MKNKLLGLGAAASAALVSAAHAAPIDISAVTTAIDDAETNVTTLGAAALGIAVLFMAYKLTRRAIGKV